MLRLDFVGLNKQNYMSNLNEQLQGDYSIKKLYGPSGKGHLYVCLNDVALPRQTKVVMEESMDTGPMTKITATIEFYIETDIFSI